MKKIVCVLVALMFVSMLGGCDYEPRDKESETVQTEPPANSNGLDFLNDFDEYGYSSEQIQNMKTILTNVGISEITELEIEPVVYGMQVVKGTIHKDPDFRYTGQDVQVQFNVENGKIYLVTIYCPSHSTANQPTYLSGLTDRRADLYYDVEGGYLKKIDWENKMVVDY